MAGTVVTLTLDQLVKQLGRDAEQVRDFLDSKAAEQTKKKISLVAIAGVKENFDKSRSPEGVAWAALRMRAGKPLLDEGLLRGATTAAITRNGVELHNNRKQARLHQVGGTVRPKSGKYLAIPLTPEAKRAGSPRAFTGLHFQQRKGSNTALLADAQGKPIFLLKTSVTVPARPFLGFSGAVLDKTERILVDDFTKTLGV